MNNYPMKVDILGKEYTILKHTFQEDPELNHLAGYCRNIVPEIVIADLKTFPDLEKEDKRVLDEMEKETLRHEVMHAFLNESGLKENSFASDHIPWAKNEEMIDWFAVQSPKIMKVFVKLGCI